MNIVALIPARGGSKGLPGKNILPLCGKPLIAYSIEEAQKCKTISRVIVSTDDQEIARTAQAYGAEVPFIRPAQLATDDAKSVDVVIHAIQWLRDHEGYNPDVMVFMQPTTPLKKAAHIDEAVSLFLSAKAGSVVSVCETEHSPYWSRVIENDTLVPLVQCDIKNARRQDLPTTYRFNGAIYIANPADIISHYSLLVEPVRPYLMCRESSIDIDALLDFKLAEIIVKEKMD